MASTIRSSSATTSASGWPTTSAPSPSRIAGLRLPGLNNLWDISIVKQIHASQRVRAQIHFEFLNAFNRVVYATPITDPTSADFGKVTSQNNLPRDIQLAMKLVF
jgi:hypothetical protein